MRFNFNSLIKKISPTLVQTGIVTLSKIAMAVAVMALQILLARLLGPEGRGSYAVIIIFSSGIASFFILGTDRAIQQQVISGRMQNGEAISLTWLLILILSLLGSLVAFPFVYYGADIGLYFFSQASIKEFSLGLLLIAPLLYGTSLMLLFYANSNFLSSSMFAVGEPVLRIILILVLILFPPITVVSVIWAALASGIVVSIIGSIFFIKQNIRGAIRLPDIKRVLVVISYGTRYLPARFGNFFRIHIPTIFLASMTGASEVGIFAVATGLAGGCLFIPEALNSVLETKILADTFVYREMVAKYMRLIGGATSLVISLMVAVLIMLVPILFGVEFEFVGNILWFLLPSLIFSTLSGPLTAYFVCTNKPQFVSLGVMAEIIVSIAALILLYPHLGIIGAPIAVSTGKVTQFVIHLFNFKTACGSSYKSIIFPGRSDLKAIIDFINIFRNTKNLIAPRGRVGRNIVLQDDVFVKIQASDIAAVEYEKTTKAATIGQETGIFYVPKIVTYSAPEGFLAIERIRGFTPLREILSSNLYPDQLINAIGRSMAAIHSKLMLPKYKSWILPSELMGNSTHLFLHGDFSIDNVGLSGDSTSKVVILDWSASDLVGGRAVFGPALFDLAWFVTSIIQLRDNFTLATDHIHLSNLILNSYRSAGGRFGINSADNEFNEYLILLLKYYANKLAATGNEKESIGWYGLLEKMGKYAN